MKGPGRLSATLFRLALGLAAPSLSREERREAVETFRELGREARNEGGRAYTAFLIREGRALLATLGDERFRGHGTPGSEAGEPGGRPRGARSQLTDILRLDLRYALRNLARSPGLVTVAVLSLTFGISVSTGLFSLVNAVLLRPLPHAEAPDQLVRVFSASRGSFHGLLSYPDFQDLRERSTTLEDLAVVRDRNVVLGSAAEGTR